MNQKFIPSLSEKVAPSIKQIHSSEYKSAAELPPGAVLVVGGGQSGCDISNDLIDAGRQVFLSSKSTPAVPRSFRGKDVMDWIILANQPDPNSAPVDLTADQFPVLSNDPEVLILDLAYLAGKGVTLLGPLHDGSGERFIFAPGINDIVEAGRRYCDSFCSKIDELIAARQIVVAEEIASTQITTPVPKIREVIDLSANASDITTIVWATGHTGTFDFVKFPVFDTNGQIIHREGVTAVDGLYFVGLPSQRNRKSGLISTIKEDASFVANKAYSALR